jgi:hypothetical protein
LADVERYMEQRQRHFTRRLRCEAEFGGVRFALTSLSKHFLPASRLSS